MHLLFRMTHVSYKVGKSDDALMRARRQAVFDVGEVRGHTVPVSAEAKLQYRLWQPPANWKRRLPGGELLSKISLNLS